MRIESVAGVADDGDADALKRRKLTDAAQQFEGMLLEQMLKPMREGGDWGEESGGGSQTMLWDGGGGEGDLKGGWAGDCAAGGAAGDA